MGLLLAGVGSMSGVLADTWRDYIYCDSLEANVLAAKGVKRVTGRSSNYKGDENIITDGSIVAVNEGQCMVIVEQGAIVDVVAQAGEYVYDSGTEPSVFGGTLGDGLQRSFEVMKKRFTFGGDTGKDQRVYFFNTKEIVGNKYGTANPVPFRVVDANIGLDVDISVRCNGEYSYKIVDPIMFYKNVCGNVSDAYTRDKIDGQLKSELLTALQPAFARISEMGIRYSAVPGHTMELAQALNDVLSESWGKRRGIVIEAFGVNSITASKEDEEMIKELQRTAVMRNPTMAAATLTSAQADAMRTAAGNESGAMMGFMGMNMAGVAGGMNAQSLYQMGQAQQTQPQQGAYATAPNGGFGNPQQAVPQQAAPQQAAPAPAGDSWTCSCGSVNTGKFCPNCGSPKPQPAAPANWFCPDCGTKNSGKFCTSCGHPRP